MERTWLITGCSSGLGKGIAKAVLARGDRAALTARAAADEKPAFDFDAWVRAFAARKYESGFSREMSRSAAVYLKDFEGWDR